MCMYACMYVHMCVWEVGTITADAQGYSQFCSGIVPSSTQVGDHVVLEIESWLAALLNKIL